jgi:hypothetical protein
MGMFDICIATRLIGAQGNNEDYDFQNRCLYVLY